MTPDDLRLPDGLEHVRTTPTFDQDSVPAGLLAEHRTGAGTWGRVVVTSGTVRFRFEDDGPTPPRTLVAGESQVVAPGRPHRLLIDGPVSFTVEFHRRR